MSDEIPDEIMEITEAFVATSNLSNTEDVEIIASLMDVCEMENNTPKKREKTEWIKPWRSVRNEKGSFSFMSKELANDKSSFFEYIRMDEKTFDYLLSGIESDIKKQDTVMRQSIPPAEKLAATLRYLATGESYKSTNYQTRLSSPFLVHAIPEVCEAIWKNFASEYLKFPTTITEWKAIAENFAIKWQFPHCLGALDGKHITFNALRKDGSFYHNYKGTNSIVLLALVDADCRFIYINVGCNGRAHDAGVLLQSDLKAVIDNADKYFPPDEVIGNGRKLPYVIIGDDAFPLQKHIMKPYSYSTNVKERKIFNIRISRARHVVEHAFGILSNRFRIFQHKINTSVENVELYTKTCCLLHNLLLQRNDKYLNCGSSAFENASENTTSAQLQSTKGAAQSIRQGFEEYFNQEGKLDWQDSKL